MTAAGYLTEIHDHTLMHLLPQMCPEDLDQRDLECRDLAVHEDASQVELYLEADVDVGTVDCWRPPQSETTVWNLIETRTLGVGQFLVFHRLLKATCFLPVSATVQCWNRCNEQLSQMDINTSIQLTSNGVVHKCSNHKCIVN